jgi:hypothetical protein
VAVVVVGVCGYDFPGFGWVFWVVVGVGWWWVGVVGDGYLVGFLLGDRIHDNVNIHISARVVSWRLEDIRASW